MAVCKLFRMRNSFVPAGSWNPTAGSWAFVGLRRVPVVKDRRSSHAASRLPVSAPYSNSKENTLTTTSRNARIAGFLYLLLAIAGPVRLMVIPTTLFVHGNAPATTGNIVAHETLFRLGIVSDLFCGTIIIFVTLALYRLFKEVDHYLAVLVVILGGVMPAAIDFFNVLNDSAALILARGADFLSVFDKPQRDALAMLFLRLHDQEVLAAEVFWGLWLVPLGILAYKSRFLPRFLGLWLILNGFAYLANSVTGLLLPRYQNAVETFTFPLLLGEVAFLLWLLIMGAKEQTREGENHPRNARHSPLEGTRGPRAD